MQRTQIVGHNWGVGKEMSAPGYWAFEEYVRGSVLRDADGFVGFDYIDKNIINPIKHMPNAEEKIAITVATFLTGGRINEVLQLHRINFDLNSHPKLVIVNRMPVEKVWEKVGEYRQEIDELPVSKATGKLTKIGKLFKQDEKGKWSRRRLITKKIDERRDFSFPKSLKHEPLLEYLLSWLEGKKEKLFRLKYITVYKALWSIPMEKHPLYVTPKNYYPHWIRAQRACHLRQYYKFDYMDFKDFFKWKSDELPSYYASLGGVAIGERILESIREKEE